MLILPSVINQHSPFKRASRREKRRRQKLWLTRLLLKSIKQKLCKFERKYSKTNIKSYKVYRIILNRAIQAAKQSYYQNIVLSYEKSPDKLWKVLDERIGTNKTGHITPNELIIKNDEIKNPQTIAETFNNYFANIYKK